MTYGEWLRQERKARRLSQESLGHLVGIGRTHVNRIERGGVHLPDESTRGRIHEALHTSEDDLVASGVLLRVVSREGGTPVYIDAHAITPGDQAAADAYDSMVWRPARAVNDHPASYDDLRQRLMRGVERATLTEAQTKALLALIESMGQDDEA